MDGRKEKKLIELSTKTMMIAIQPVNSLSFIKQLTGISLLFAWKRKTTALTYQQRQMYISAILFTIFTHPSITARLQFFKPYNSAPTPLFNYFIVAFESKIKTTKIKTTRSSTNGFLCAHFFIIIDLNRAHHMALIKRINRASECFA